MSGGSSAVAQSRLPNGTIAHDGPKNDIPRIRACVEGLRLEQMPTLPVK